MTAPTVDHPLDWQRDAACRGMNRDLFFPEYGFMLEPRVIATCHRCPVRERCLQWALDNDEENGVWGGLTEDQRRAINQTRERVRCPDCRSTQIFNDGETETCVSCGLSWRC